MKSFFNPKEICQIFDVSYRQLQYWDKSDFIKPSYESKRKFRSYTFSDLLLVQTAVALREKGNSIQKIRKTIQVMEQLLAKVEHPLIELTFLIDQERILVFNGDVVVDEEAREDYLRIHVESLRERIDGIFGFKPETPDLPRDQWQM